jgi:hypothetical protein
MGVLYEAVQESMGRRVALKVLARNGRLGASQIERFRLEARSAGQLRHSNIVPIDGVGEHQGVLYYAMQFIEGHGLGIDTGTGTNAIVVDGPAGGDDAYLDGNVNVFGGFGGTTDVSIFDFNNTTPTNWYYVDYTVTEVLFSYGVAKYWRSGSPYSITLSNVSGTDFWGSSTDTLSYGLRLFGLAVTTSSSSGSGSGAGAGPRLGVRQSSGATGSSASGPARAKFVAGACALSSDLLHDDSLESILAEAKASEFPLVGMGAAKSSGPARIG